VRARVDVCGGARVDIHPIAAAAIASVVGKRGGR
jgi:hypothetical protein